MYRFVNGRTKKKGLHLALAMVVALTSAAPVYAVDFGEAPASGVISEPEKDYIKETTPIAEENANQEDSPITLENVAEADTGSANETGGTSGEQEGSSASEKPDVQENTVPKTLLDATKGTPESPITEEGLPGMQLMSTPPSDFVSMDGKLFSYTGSDEVVTIPEGITEIVTEAFKNNSTMREVRIPASVSNIGINAFQACSALRSVVIEEGVSNLIIGAKAFSNCTNLRHVTLPEGVTEIGTEAFIGHGTQFNTLEIPASVTKLGNAVGDVFINMTGNTAPSGITHIHIAADNEAYYSYDGAVYDKESDRLLYFPGARLGSYHIADEAKAIAENAFRNAKLNSVTLPSGITQIEASAFRGSKLTNIVIPGSVTSIGAYAFYNSQIETVELQNGVETIGNSAFETCYSLQSLHFPASVTSIGNGAISDNGSPFKWLHIDNPDAVLGTNIVDYYMSITFYGETDSTTQAYVTAVQDEKGSSAKISFASTDTFSGVETIALNPSTLNMDLKQTAEINAEITPTSAEAVGVAWYSSDTTVASVAKKKNGSVTNDKIGVITANKKGTATITAKTADGKTASCLVTVTKGVDQSDFILNAEGLITGYIGEDVHINIPAEISGQAVKGIAADAFSYNTFIETVNIPANVKTIGEEAFAECKVLEEVVLADGVEKIAPSAFQSNTKLEHINLPNSITSVGRGAFASCTGLQSATLSTGLTALEEEVFLGCSNLKSIVIPQGITAIKEQAFGRCSKLESIAFPAQGLKTIGASAFAGCFALQSVAIPEGVESIGKYAFLDCNGLRSFSLPSTFSEFGGTFFYQMFEKYDLSIGGHLLTEITVADGNDTYQSKDGLVYKGETLVFCPRARESAVVKEGTTRVGDYAFFICFELKRVELPSTLKSIGTNAFHNCESLSYCVLPQGLESIENSAFFACESWEDVVIPTTVTNLEAYSLAECAAEELIIPPNITRIEEYTFWGYEETLKRVQLPDTLTYIGDSAFAWAKNLEYIHIPEGVTYVGSQAFGRCDNLTYLTLPSTIEEIGTGAFTGNKSMQGIYIPSSITTIGTDIFQSVTQPVTLLSDQDNSIVKTYAEANNHAFAVLQKDTAIGNGALSLMAEDHQNLIAQGETDVKLTETFTEKTVDPEAGVVQAIQAIANRYIAARYFDLTFTKAVGASEAVPVLSSQKPITIAIEIPDSLHKEKREYQLAVVQNGTVTLFDTEINGKFLIAEANKYGSFALLYRDPKKPSSSDDSDQSSSSGGSGGGKASQTNSNSVTFEKQGDSIKLSITESQLATLVAKAEDGQVHLDFSEERGATSATIPALAAKGLVKESLGINIVLPEGSIHLDSSSLASVVNQLDGTTFSISLKEADVDGLNEAQQSAAQDGMVYDISIFAGDQHLSGFDGGTLSITLPYALKEGETAEGVSVWYLNEEGSLEKIPCTFDIKTETVSFQTTHLSYYKVGYEEAVSSSWKNPFRDVSAQEWFYEDVKYATENGLFVGISEDLFAPNTGMTRAMLVTALWRLEDKPSAANNSFTDIADGMWYTDAVAWAAAQNIVSGISDTAFAPDAPITREQMASIFYRYAKSNEMDTTSKGDITTFADQAAISDWAKDGIAWTLGSQLLYGKEETRFDPQGGATRAEVAALMHRFAEKGAE